MTSKHSEIKIVKEAEVVPMAVNVNTVLSNDLNEALAAANTVAKEMLQTSLDRLTTTPPEMLAKIGRITLTQEFSLVPGAQRLEIDIK